MKKNGNGKATMPNPVKFSFCDDSQEVSIPEWVTDQESFRRWAGADDFPEAGRISWLRGEVLIDMSKEQVYWHSDVKSEVGRVLRNIAKAEKAGRYLTDGPLLSNEAADISVKPDGIFISTASVKAGLVRVLEGIEEGHLEIDGSPDMVLEVVSRRSIRKDTIILREAYWKAGVKEYWLIDARKEPLSFDIFHAAENGYTAARKQKGWVRSLVFARAFRLVQTLDAVNAPEYTLEFR